MLTKHQQTSFSQKKSKIFGIFEPKFGTRLTYEQLEMIMSVFECVILDEDKNFLFDCKNQHHLEVIRLVNKFRLPDANDVSFYNLDMNNDFISDFIAQSLPNKLSNLYFYSGREKQVISSFFYPLSKIAYRLESKVIFSN